MANSENPCGTKLAGTVQQKRDVTLRSAQTEASGNPGCGLHPGPVSVFDRWNIDMDGPPAKPTKPRTVAGILKNHTSDGANTMKDILRTAGMTLAVFLAGLLAGSWISHLRPMPPPPMPPMGEIGFPPGPFGEEPVKFPLSPEKAVELEAAMAKVRPRIEAFEKQLAEIETRFREKFEAILTPEQKSLATKNRPPAFLPPPSHSPDHVMGPLGGIAFFTIITPALDHFTKELGLTPVQQKQLKELMLERRGEFLLLVDTTPPPSLELGHIGHD